MLRRAVDVMAGDSSIFVRAGNATRIARSGVFAQNSALYA